MVLIYRKPRDIPRPGADSSGNPHPDQTAANKAKGVDVYLVMAYSRPGLTADTFKVRHWCYAHGAHLELSSTTLLASARGLCIKGLINCTWQYPLGLLMIYRDTTACKTTRMAYIQ